VQVLVHAQIVKLASIALLVLLSNSTVQLALTVQPRLQYAHRVLLAISLLQVLLHAQSALQCITAKTRLLIIPS